MLYCEWLSSWLEDYVRPSLKARTYERYKEIVAHHVAPRLGSAELSELTPLTLQHTVTELLRCGNMKNGEGLSPSSVNSVINVIQGSLRTAHLVGLTAEYVGDRIRRPRLCERRVECFSLAEQRRIEEYSLSSKGDRLFGVYLALYTGLRIGELLALEWSDIDEGRSELYVRRSCHYAKGEDGSFGRIIDTPKSIASERTIPIPEALMPRLLAVRERSLSEIVVASGARAISTRSYQRSFAIMLEHLGIARHGFHALRHTFATRALECGMDVRTLSEILGHKNPAVTLGRYAHSLAEHKREMMNRLGRLADPTERATY